MSDEEWQPRRDDHLVEPFFVGLDAPREVERAESTLRFLGRLLLPAAILAAVLTALALGLGLLAGTE
jgi:hypothetical protein